ncbi:hypothetical protein M5K25_027844 [Dendrobium thyrsiflorum]|uniref:Reverse transcriptase zinc-binding domain-containing protein n=1 Tax=Dendrobium thyrsiflorum TaxID=117978 RepID=A0ABD0TUX4_DENTH
MFDPCLTTFRMMWHLLFRLPLYMILLLFAYPGVFGFCVVGYYGRIKTTDLLLKRNIHVASIYLLCYSENESIKHMFLECNFSFSIILSIISEACTLLLRPGILQLLYWINECSSFSLVVKKFYYLATCCSVYFIWRERNERRFGSNGNCPTSMAIKIKKAIFAKVIKWKNYECLLDRF